MACVKNLITKFFCLLANKKTVKAWSIFYVTFLCLLFVFVFQKKFLLRSTDFADLFINYSGGFVRRGLLGQFFLWCHHIGIDPIWTAAVMSFTSFLIVATYMIVQFRKRGYNLCILTVGWFLGGIGIYRLPTMRRDYIIMAMFLLVVWLWKRIGVWKWVAIANILVCITILCYEPFALFAIPFCILLTNLRWKSWGKSVAVWALPVLTFLLCCKYSGNKEIYDAIIASTNDFLAKPGIIGFLLMDSSEAMRFHIHCNFLSFSHGIPVVLLSFVSLSCLVYYSVNAIPVFSEEKKDFSNRRYVLAFLMCAFAVLSPMFVCLSTDYGRTTIYVVLSSYFLFLTLDEKERAELLPSFMYKIADSLLAFADKHLRPTRYKIVFIMYFVGISYWTGGGIRGFISSSEVGYLPSCIWTALEKSNLFLQLLHII